MNEGRVHYFRKGLEKSGGKATYRNQNKYHHVILSLKPFLAPRIKLLPLRAPAVPPTETLSIYNSLRTSAHSSGSTVRTGIIQGVHLHLSGAQNTI